jgi:hypothetical protein
MKSHVNNVVASNKQLILEHVEVHPGDMAIIDSTVEKLAELGIGLITSIMQQETERIGWALLLNDDEDRVFYLVLNEYGGIELLRKDGSDGEVVFAVFYD